MYSKCKSCSKKAVAGKNYCQYHIEYNSKRAKERYRKLKESGRCLTCPNQLKMVLYYAKIVGEKN